MERAIYYRRTERPYAFPATLPQRIDVSLVWQETGPGDGDWQATKIDLDDPVGSLDLHTEYTEAAMIADALTCEAAILEYLGVKLPLDCEFGVYEPKDLDDTAHGEDAHKSLCDALEYLCGPVAANEQRRAIRERLSGAYLRTHDLMEEAGANDT